MPPHWLAPGAKTWSPDVVLSFDTETTEIPESDGLHHVIRCWDAVLDIRHDVALTRSRRRLFAGQEPSELADICEQSVEITGELWVYAHNLNFDLTVTQLPAMLVYRNWSVDAYGMSKESNWWVLKRDGQKLVIADSWSWVAASLASCGKDIGKRKLPLPGTDESLKSWHARCRHDAEILSAMMLTLMNWWDREQLGRWSITGSGCGWQTLRTMTGRKRIVVGPDGQRTTFERSAIYGGRKEVFQVGKFHGEWCADYDFFAAYPTIVAHFPLPVAPGKPFDTLPRGLTPGESDKRDIIAECFVTTERPCCPVRIGSDVWWPTGTFATVLTGPEIAYARSVGASVEVRAGYVYPMGFALRDWGTWVLSVLQSNVAQHPAIVRRMAKGWSRSVVGRFGSRTSTITADRPAIGYGWRLDVGHNLTNGRPLEVLTIGDRELTTEHNIDGPDCFPAVLAFVEARCRVALGQMLNSRTPDRILQCNTDGWWERRITRSAAYDLDGVPWPFKVVRKALVNEVAILGPDHLQTPAERRLSGVPRAAEVDPAGHWAWHDWPGLRWQLQRATGATYVRPPRSLNLQAHYARRWVLANGETVPVSTSMDKTTLPQLDSWGNTQSRRHADALAPYQDQRLEPLRSLDGAPPPIFEGAGPRLPGRSRWLRR